MPSYKFRILIDTTSQEEIFRDILISTKADFETFYQAIMQAFNFRGDQLASFYVSNEQWDKGHEIVLMDMGVGNNLDSPSVMKETILEEIVSTDDQKFILVYDFLKMWCFLIELIEKSDDEPEIPTVALTMGLAPDEDSKDIDMGDEMNFGAPADLGNDIDDIFSEFGEDDDEMQSFENLDDLDI
ncbi:MAG: plasmid pRiA4b ORF-3 family protein [Flavobacteriales bacterium]|jgi:hypothetical protein|nr:plasmid pRiA4b ORF-3 family protein [Flavobacteriales bacterium]